jgi:uncharacterized protein YndB with AHSA1/START domain
MAGSSIDSVALVTREVRSGSRTGRPTKIAVARRSYSTGQADLWEALTSPERLPRWFLPVTGELRVGGRYQLVGNAGGVVERCEEPDSFAVTWEFGSMLSWVEVRLRAADGGTQLELTHEAHVDPDMWGQYGPGAVGVGWDLALLGLAWHIRSGAPVDAAQALAFPTSPDGIAYVRSAAGFWADAAVADGDEASLAHEAAQRTVAFYTTEPEPEAPASS